MARKGFASILLIIALIFVGIGVWFGISKIRKDQGLAPAPTISPTSWKIYQLHFGKVNMSVESFREPQESATLEEYKNGAITISDKSNFDSNKLKICPDTPSDSKEMCRINENKIGVYDTGLIIVGGEHAFAFKVYEPKFNSVIGVTQIYNGLEVAMAVDGVGLYDDYGRILSSIKFN